MCPLTLPLSAKTRQQEVRILTARTSGLWYLFITTIQGSVSHDEHCSRRGTGKEIVYNCGLNYKSKKVRRNCTSPEYCILYLYYLCKYIVFLFLIPPLNGSLPCPSDTNLPDNALNVSVLHRQYRFSTIFHIIDSRKTRYLQL